MILKNLENLTTVVEIPNNSQDFHYSHSLNKGKTKEELKEFLRRLKIRYIKSHSHIEDIYSLIKTKEEELLSMDNNCLNDYLTFTQGSKSLSDGCVNGKLNADMPFKDNVDSILSEIVMGEINKIASKSNTNICNDIEYDDMCPTQSIDSYITNEAILGCKKLNSNNIHGYNYQIKNIIISYDIFKEMLTTHDIQTSDGYLPHFSLFGFDVIINNGQGHGHSTNDVIIRYDSYHISPYSEPVLLYKNVEDHYNGNYTLYYSFNMDSYENNEGEFDMGWFNVNGL